MPSQFDTIRDWIGDLTGIRPIPYAPDKPRPARPYLMLHLTDVAPLTQAPAHILPTGDDADPTDTIITDTELRTSLHAYGDDAVDRLTIFAGVRHLPSVCAPLGAIRLHEVGRIESVPELVGTKYEDRSILRLIFHAPAIGVHPGSAIKVAPVTVIEESSQ